MARDSLVNHRLNDYFIESLLGKGGMARVYRAVDTRRQRYVALKVINASYQDNPDVINRFAREAQVIAQLGQHPNVVQLYNYGEDQGYLYIAMQYIEGTDLAALLHSYRQDGEWMTFPEVLTIMRDITSALDYIHSREVVHRDLKPSNIMLDRQGRAVLTDFGLALLTDVGTLGEVFGSPAYIAPEQAISSAEARPESDLYALGVILFEMLTGQLPFNAHDPLSLAMKHVQQPAPAPSSLRRELGPAVDRVVLKALAKNPNERYPSGYELMTDLQRALEPAAAAAAPPPTLAHLTIPDRVRLQSEPLPPPNPPPTAPPAPPSTTLLEEDWRASQDRLPAGGWSPEVTSGRVPAGGPPRVIPAPVRASNPWPTIMTVVGLITLLVSLLCVGGGLAMRAMLNPSRTQVGQVLPATGRTPSPGLPPTEPAVTAGVPLIQTLFPAHTPEPSATPQPTQAPTNTPEPPATATPEPSEPPSAVPSDSPAALLVMRLPQDHLLLANNGQLPFRLGPLRVGRDDDAIVGSELGPAALDPGQCLIVMNPVKRPHFPENLQCDLLMVIQRQPETTFWKDGFEVFYDDTPVGECRRNEDACTIPLPSSE